MKRGFHIRDYRIWLAGVAVIAITVALWLAFHSDQSPKNISTHSRSQSSDVAQGPTESDSTGNVPSTPAGIPDPKNADGFTDGNTKPTVAPAGLRMAFALARVPWKRDIDHPSPANVALAQDQSNREGPPLEQQRDADEKAGKYENASIQLVGGFECAYLPEPKKLSPTHFVLDFKGEVTHMFLFKVTGAAGKTVRIDLANVDMGKWHSLNPVISYARNLGDLPSFETKPMNEKLVTMAAFNGPTLPDTREQPWRYISDVWESTAWNDAGNTLSLVFSAEQDDAVVAMKYPYTVAYNEAFLKSISNAPNVTLLTVGKSKDGRPLQLVKIAEGTEQEQKTKPCILMYAREHADEHDTSWIVQGAIQYLISDSPDAKRLVAENVFLFIPLLDPDAAAKNTHESVIESFVIGHDTSESFAYSAYFRKRVEEGSRLDFVLNIHNIESGESGEHIIWALGEPKTGREVSGRKFHEILTARLHNSPCNTNTDPWYKTYMSFRLGGYLAKFYGPFHLAYEINSQSPDRHLTLDDLRGGGANILWAAPTYLATPDGRAMMAGVDATRKNRDAMWTKYIDILQKNRQFGNAIGMESLTQILRSLTMESKGLRECDSKIPCAHP